MGHGLAAGWPSIAPPGPTPGPHPPGRAVLLSRRPALIFWRSEVVPTICRHAYGSLRPDRALKRLLWQIDNLFLPIITSFKSLATPTLKAHCCLRSFPCRCLLFRFRLFVSRQNNRKAPRMNLNSVEPLADNPASAAKRLGVGRAQLYLEISAGRLAARKAGRRTLIERTEQARWLEALPLKGSRA